MKKLKAAVEDNKEKKKTFEEKLNVSVKPSRPAEHEQELKEE